MLAFLKILHSSTQFPSSKKLKILGIKNKDHSRIWQQKTFQFPGLNKATPINYHAQVELFAVVFRVYFRPPLFNPRATRRQPPCIKGGVSVGCKTNRQGKHSRVLYYFLHITTVLFERIVVFDLSLKRRRKHVGCFCGNQCVAERCFDASFAENHMRLLFFIDNCIIIIITTF